MTTTTKLQVALSAAIVSSLALSNLSSDPDSPVTLSAVGVLILSVYFFFRYNNQIKRLKKMGSIPEPTVEAKRRHFWTLAASLGLGGLMGTCIIVYSLLPIFGLLYAVLLAFPYDLFLAYLVYWLWRKFYRA